MQDLSFRKFTKLVFDNFATRMPGVKKIDVYCFRFESGLNKKSSPSHLMNRMAVCNDSIEIEDYGFQHEAT